MQTTPTLLPELHLLTAVVQLPPGQSALRLQGLPALLPAVQVGRQGPANVGVQSSSVVQFSPSRSPPAQSPPPPFLQSAFVLQLVKLGANAFAYEQDSPSSQGVPSGA